MEKKPGTPHNRKYSLLLRNAMALLFVLFICSGFTQMCKSVNKVSTTNIRESIESYFTDIQNRERYIELYGAMQRLLGKRQIENFTIYKNNYGRLVMPRSELSNDEIHAKVEELGSVFQHLDEMKIPYLYIESPLPIKSEEELPYGVQDYSSANAKKLHKMISNITTLNVTGSINVSNQDMFYRTDHHWSGDASFETYKAVEEWLLKENIISSRRGDSKFERIAVSGFLGSYGIKAGHIYAGTDDYVYYLPKFRTNFIYEGKDVGDMVTNVQQGEWDSALIDRSILENSDYYNKYNAILWGNSGENRIINVDDTNGKKLLIISHSYGRPLAAYLALDLHETRQIDPQEGRFEGNYIEYIDEYNPDAVLFLCEFEGEIIGSYRTETKKAE